MAIRGERRRAVAKSAGDRVRSHSRKPTARRIWSRHRRDFKIATAERKVRTYRMFPRDTDGARWRAIATDRRLTHGARISRDLPAIPYAFGKFVSSPSPPSVRGMDHAVKMLYNARAGARRIGAQTIARSRLVIAPETAHMWFGIGHHAVVQDV